MKYWGEGCGPWEVTIANRPSLHSLWERNRRANGATLMVLRDSSRGILKSM